MMGCDGMGDVDGRSLDGAESSSSSAGDETAGDDGDGCTLTQGYWKNHHAGSKNKSQQSPWPVSEDTELCGQTWLDILDTAPKGNPWIVVAHQWIAASLNVAAGAAVPPEVAAALADAEGFLADCEITKAEKAAALASKDVLDAFNNGNIGPGHCGDGDLPGEPPAETTGDEPGTTTGDEPGTTGDEPSTTSGTTDPIPG